MITVSELREAGIQGFTYANEFQREHPVATIGIGVLAWASAGYTLYRVGRGIGKLINKFRR